MSKRNKPSPFIQKAKQALWHGLFGACALMLSGCAINVPQKANPMKALSNPDQGISLNRKQAPTEPPTFLGLPLDKTFSHFSVRGLMESLNLSQYESWQKRNGDVGELFDACLKNPNAYLERCMT